MLPFNARNSNQGFTLAETVVIAVVIGILAAIAIPSFLGWLNRKKVEDALVQVQGALQEAQREAMKRSRACTVTLNTTNYKVTGSCLTTERELCDKRDASGVCLQPKVSISIPTSNYAGGNQIVYGIRGNTASGGTVRIFRSDVSEQRCLVTSPGIGLMRTGIYSNGSCRTS